MDQEFAEAKDFIDELWSENSKLEKENEELKKKLSDKLEKIGKDEFSIEELVFLEDCVGFSSAQSYKAKAMYKKLKEMVKEAKKEA